MKSVCFLPERNKLYALPVRVISEGRVILQLLVNLRSLQMVLKGTNKFTDLCTTPSASGQFALIACLLCHSTRHGKCYYSFS